MTVIVIRVADRAHSLKNTVLVNTYTHKYKYLYTGCHRRNGPNFGRVFLMLNYTDITQNTYVQS